MSHRSPRCANGCMPKHRRDSACGKTTGGRRLPYRPRISPTRYASVPSACRSHTVTLLTTKIIPEAKRRVNGTPVHTCIAGYSLAGLFALYATYQCDEFDLVASMSGSLWYPGFRDHVLSHSTRKNPERVYISLGDAEARTRNPVLKTVQENTEAIVTHLEGHGKDIT